MDSLTPIASLHSQILDLPPSCAQFCPAHPGYLVVGTYELQKDDAEGFSSSSSPAASKPQSRSGSLVVFKLTGDKLVKVQTISQPSALLDLRFYRESAGHGHGHGQENVLAAVSSTGTLAVFRLDPEHRDSSDDALLRHVATSRCDDLDEGVLFLQCQWHPVVPRVLGVTTSTGLVRLLCLAEDWTIRSFADLGGITNSLEAWCLAFSPRATERSRDADAGAAASVYSGGDDAMLRYTSCVAEPSSASASSSSSPSFIEPHASRTIRGQHDAGVTAILPLGLRAQDGGRVVVTGSYDDHLRVLSIGDLHQAQGARRAELLADVDLGGGVWRLDLVNVRAVEGGTDASTSTSISGSGSGSGSGRMRRIRVLASCMHAGARLVEIVERTSMDEDEGGSRWECRVLARFEEHKSMNYASGVARMGWECAGAGDEVLRVVSTSFYDRLLCLWEYSPSK